MIASFSGFGTIWSQPAAPGLRVLSDLGLNFQGLAFCRDIPSYQRISNPGDKNPKTRKKISYQPINNYKLIDI